MENIVNPWRVLAKAIILYLVFEVAFFFSDFNVSQMNIYRAPSLQWERFPFRAEPDTDFPALDVGILDTLFSSHVISRPKEADEFRVIFLGDSGMWGAPLPPDAMLSSQLNDMDLSCAGKEVVAYNLAYPWPSAIKDILILDRALKYEPDLVIWSVTTLTLTTQLVEDHPLFGTTEGDLHELMTRLGIMEKKFPPVPLEEQFVYEQVSAYRTLRFQSFELIRLARGVQQDVQLGPIGNGLSDDPVFFDILKPPTLEEKELSLNLVNVLHRVAGDIPVIAMNEPIMVVENAPNSNVRYNSYYPRWAYDQYRDYMNNAALENGWHYLDYWDMFTPEFFADTPLHLTRNGEEQLAETLAPVIIDVCSK